GVPSVSFNALIGHRSCAPEDYRKDLRTLRQGPVPVSCVFPAGSDSRLLETRLQAIRLSPYRADLPARRPARLGNGRRFPGMLLSPVTFQITGQPSDPKTPPPVHARYAGYIAVRLVAHAEHPFLRCYHHYADLPALVPYRRLFARGPSAGVVTESDVERP